MSTLEPYYAVIFSSQRSAVERGYAEAAERMLELAAEQPGYLGVESARGSDGFGITVSYWGSLEAIRSWKAVAEHREAQRSGRNEWYRHYRVRIVRVEREYAFESTTSDPA
jgi:heme-degrading monooxygenase HmoA